MNEDRKLEIAVEKARGTQVFETLGLGSRRLWYMTRPNAEGKIVYSQAVLQEGRNLEEAWEHLAGRCLSNYDALWELQMSIIDRGEHSTDDVPEVLITWGWMNGGPTCTIFTEFGTFCDIEGVDPGPQLCRAFLAMCEAKGRL